MALVMLATLRGDESRGYWPVKAKVIRSNRRHQQERGRQNRNRREEDEEEEETT